MFRSPVDWIEGCLVDSVPDPDGALRLSRGLLAGLSWLGAPFYALAPAFDRMMSCNRLPDGS